jgi:hypothetical protein
MKTKVFKYTLIVSVLFNFTLLYFVWDKECRINELKQKNNRYSWYAWCAETLISHFAGSVKANPRIANWFATDDGERYFKARENMITHNGLGGRYMDIEELKYSVVKH